MGSDERKRIKELMKERERDDGMMDWMYKTSKPDAEEYLLGRKIDKIFEQEEEPPEDKNDPGAIFNERVKANIAMDMAAKMREDPLFQIKKREEDAKKTLLQNPVKMRQLQKLVKEKEKSKHKKKKKKHKKKKAQSSDDESDDDDGEDDIMKKYLAVLSKKHKPKSAEASGGGRRKHKHRGDNQRDEDGQDHSVQRSRKEHKDRRKKRSSSPEINHSRKREMREGRKSSSPSPNHRKAASKQYGLLLRGEDSRVDEASKRSQSPKMSGSRSLEHRKSQMRKKSPKVKPRSQRRSTSRSPVRKRSRSRSPVRKRSRSPTRKRSRSPTRKRSKSPHRQRSRSPVRRRSPYRRRSRSPINERSHRRSRSRSPAEKATKKKLTEEEKLRKLEEMQENAKWRDNQREKNVKRYREEADAEEKSHLNKGSSADFLNPLMAGHVSQSSVQDRIKRNIYNVQRTKSDLDKDFTRR